MATLTLNTSDYFSAVEKSKTAGKTLESSVTQLANKYKSQGLSMSEAMKKTHSDIEQKAKEAYISAKGSLNGYVSTAEQDSKKISSSFKKAWTESGTGVSTLGSKITGIIAGLGIASLAKNMVTLGVTTNATLEQSTVAWGTLLGGETAAKDMVEKITDYAAKTPFSKMGVDTMAKQLNNAGFKGEEVFTQLTKIGDLGSAFGIQEDALIEMTRQYSQVQQAGVAYTEDLNILQDKGIPIYKALAEATGTSVAEVRKLASDGKISTEIYNKAIDKMASNTKGAMDSQSKTFNGLWSTIKDGAENAVGKIMSPLFKALKGLMEKVSPIIDKVSGALTTMFDDIDSGVSPIEAFKKAFSGIIPEGVLNVIGAVADGIGWVTSNLNIIIPVVGGLTLGFIALTKAQEVWNVVTTALTGPLGIAKLAIAGVTAAIIWLAQKTGDQQTKEEEYAEAARKATQATNDRKKSYEDMSVAQDASTQKDLAQLDNVQKLYNELKTLTDENGNVTDANKARAQFIIDQLNPALGLELGLTGNQVTGNADLATSIDTLIEKKRAQIILDAEGIKYAENLKNAQTEQANKETQLQAIKTIGMEVTRAQMELDNDKTQLTYQNLDGERSAEEIAKIQKQNNLDELKRQLTDATDSYNASDVALQGYHSNIQSYESASTAFLAGKTDEAIGILESKNSAFKTAASVVGSSADEQTRILTQQVTDTERTSAELKELLKNQTQGVTQDMVDTAEAQAAKAREEARKIGVNIPEGISAGIEANTPTVEVAAQDMATNVVSAADSEADLQSVGSNSILGFWGGMEDKESWLYSNITGFFGNVTQRIKDFFGIKSPSRLFRDMIGKNLALGIGVGFEGEMPKVGDMMIDSMPTTQSFLANAQTATTGATAGTNFTQIINSAKVLSPSEISSETQNALYRMRWSI